MYYCAANSTTLVTQNRVTPKEYDLINIFCEIAAIFYENNIYLTVLLMLLLIILWVLMFILALEQR